MKILVIGSGAREHAICEALSSDSNQIFCAPRNDGMNHSGIRTVPILENDFEGLVNFAIKENIAFTIVGPEEPLVNGVVDFFEAHGLRIFGPNKKAARIEGSKAFTKSLLKLASIPTAEFCEFTEFSLAEKYIKRKSDYPLVIKADGLAAGKGVYIVENQDDALNVVSELLNSHKFETHKVVIEEYLDGEEFSLMAFVNNGKFYPMPAAQDYKKLNNGDKGPNTGGMGAVCPVKNISESIYNQAINKVLKPFVDILVEEGIKYTGVLYAGLILTNKGIKVIEFNVRFGDPETEVVLPRLQTNLSNVIFSILNDDIPEIHWKNSGLDLGVFISSKGYPEAPIKDATLGSTESFDSLNCKINYAGIKMKDTSFWTNGGRLFVLKTHSENLLDAQREIYTNVKKLDHTNIFYRTDIGNNSI
ncbi:phosphoribosylamine--glycine ligase [Companilactobacillus insicii]|uniref:phosphoribosylamine--glycine ligase n=1 Tax=Companilactobacillus insicii TaxID=1732567 RepID=UPI000F7801DD|nr:phosphoribosylamine--glycine ligase [Companilactobacillus insicii]